MPSVHYLSLFLFKVNIVRNQARSSDYEATEATHILKKYTEGKTFYKTFTDPPSQTSAPCLRPWLKNCKIITIISFLYLCVLIFKRKKIKLGKTRKRTFKDFYSQCLWEHKWRQSF